MTKVARAHRLIAPWVAYRLGLGSVVGGIFVIGGLLGAVLGAGWLVAPVLLLGSYFVWMGLDACFFLVVRLRDGEVAVGPTWYSAMDVSVVEVAPWKQNLRYGTVDGFALLLHVAGTRVVTPLCYPDQVEAEAMAQYLAAHLSAELAYSETIPVESSELPSPYDLGANLVWAFKSRRAVPKALNPPSQHSPE